MLPIKVPNIYQFVAGSVFEEASELTNIINRRTKDNRQVWQKCLLLGFVDLFDGAFCVDGVY